MKVCFTNLGCKLNQAELEAIARRFAGAGHAVVDEVEAADLHVINSCTVTHVAARTSRKEARRSSRRNPGVRTVLTGCYVSGSPSEAAELAGVDLVVPNAEKDRLLETVHAAFPGLGEGTSPGSVPYGPLAWGNSRALVKIEDGCNMRCAFCIIPSTRGSQRSRPPEKIVDEVAALEAGGYREIVLTGVQISHYRRAGTSLFELAREILGSTVEVRLRLTSLAPWRFDDRLLDLVETGRVCRHVHLSLQSGSTSTLDRMRRPYTAGDYADLVDRIRRRVPSIAVTTDVIAGFPGETDTEFEESLAFVEDRAFAKIHAFPYSPRPGTEAAEMDRQVPHEAIRERMECLLAVARASEDRFRRSALGTVEDVLWEERRDGRWLGTTGNYLRVACRSDRSLRRRLAPAILESYDGDGIVAARIVEGPPGRATAAEGAA